MIKATINTNRIKLEGHAGYAEAGKDIVCAAVTGIWYALRTKLEKEQEKGNLKLEKEELPGYLDIRIEQVAVSNEKMVDEVIDTALCGFEEIAEYYPENLFVKKV